MTQEELDKKLKRLQRARRPFFIRETTFNRERARAKLELLREYKNSYERS